MTKKTLSASKNLLERGAFPSVPQIRRKANEDLPVCKNSNRKSNVMRQSAFPESEEVILDSPEIVTIVGTVAKHTDQNQGYIIGSRHRWLGERPQVVRLNKLIVEGYGRYT
jgi:hypothetical protein